MPKVYKIGEEEAEKIREQMKAVKNANAYRKLQAVALRGEGKSNKEVAEITKYHPDWVSRLVSIYCNEGIEAISEDGRKGGNNRNLSQSQAEDLLETFREQAEKGQMTTIKEFAAEYDKATGKEHKSKSAAYYFLHSMGWRKIMPRPEHPKKADDEAIEASKKLTIFTSG